MHLTATSHHHNRRRPILQKHHAPMVFLGTPPPVRWRDVQGFPHRHKGTKGALISRKLGKTLLSSLAAVKEGLAAGRPGLEMEAAPPHVIASPSTRHSASFRIKSAVQPALHTGTEPWLKPPWLSNNLQQGTTTDTCRERRRALSRTTPTSLCLRAGACSRPSGDLGPVSARFRMSLRPQPICVHSRPLLPSSHGGIALTLLPSRSGSSQRQFSVFS